MNIQKMIDIELKVKDLYEKFSKKFSANKKFWYELAQEEYNHASLLISVKKFFSKLSDYKGELSGKEFKAIDRIEKLISEAENNLKSESFNESIACQIAIEIEDSCCEAYFQSEMVIDSPTEILSVLQKLNGQEINHALRIKEHMESLKS